MKHIAWKMFHKYIVCIILAAPCTFRKYMQFVEKTTNKNMNNVSEIVKHFLKQHNKLVLSNIFYEIFVSCNIVRFSIVIFWNVASYTCFVFHAMYFIGVRHVLISSNIFFKIHICFLYGITDKINCMKYETLCNMSINCNGTTYIVTRNKYLMKYIWQN